MSLSPAILDAMVASGCTAEQIAAVVKASLADEQARIETKRAADAERQRRHRKSRNVTVTERDDAVTAPPPSSPPNDIYSNPPHHPPAPETPDGVSESVRGQCEQVVEAFNAVAKPLKLSTCQKLSPARLKACKARIRDHGLEAILTAIQRIPESSFLRGATGNWGGANIDFLLRPDSVTKILEGKYDDRAAAPSGNSNDGLVVALRRRLDAHDAEEPSSGADGRTVRSGQGYSQGALALPGPDR